MSAEKVDPKKTAAAPEAPAPAVAEKKTTVEDIAAEAKDRIDQIMHGGRVLIVGMSGYLGSALAVGLRNHYEVFGTYNNHPIRIEGTTSFKMDCLNGGEILDALKRIHPETILFCSGLTDIDICEEHVNYAEGLNFQAAALFFKVSPIPVRFIYFSCSDVFGGLLSEQAAPYIETHQPDPINAYGTTKVHGEAMVMGHQRLTSVVRLSHLYGEPFGGTANNRTTWISDLQKKLERREAAPAYKDMVRSHLYVGDVVRGVRKFLAEPPEVAQLYNFAGKDMMSSYDFAVLFAKEFGYDPNLVRPISFRDDTKLKAPRAVNCSLSAGKFESNYKFKFQSAKHGLMELAERYRTGFSGDWP